eukprot:441993-Hanusia_phi.AAC.1
MPVMDAVQSHRHRRFGFLEPLVGQPLSSCRSAALRGPDSRSAGPRPRPGPAGPAPPENSEVGDS